MILANASKKSTFLMNAKDFLPWFVFLVGFLGL
jgi:hypothetical protein